MTLSVVSGVFLVNIRKFKKYGTQNFFLAEILKSQEIFIFSGTDGKGSQNQ
jgi:hypothetical protein